MIYPGKNLFISRNGSVIYGAKSCSVNIENDLIETASPTSGRWKEFLPGRLEWDLSVSELVGTTEGSNAKIVAFSTSHNGLINVPEPASIQSPNGNIYTFQTGPRMILYGFNYYGTLVNQYNLDIYNDESNLNTMATYINNIRSAATMRYIAIVTTDAIRFNSTFLAALANIGIDTTYFPTGQFRGAFAAVAAFKNTEGRNGAVWQLSTQEGGVAHAEQNVIITNIENAGANIAQTLRNTLLSVGNIYNISVQVDGFPQDRLSGTAICQKATVTGSLGNLCQGSFKFKGTGALT